MHLTNTIFVAVALSFDAMAVGTANAAHHHIPLSKALKISFFFGFFQLLMPLIGWLIGTGFEQYITKYDHWISFLLLGALGVKMIFESFENVEEEKIDIHNWKILLMLAVATSVDALVVGISFAFMSLNVYLAVAIIGITTFVLTLLSIYLGKKIGERWGRKSEIIGGFILILIGLKILLTHLLA